MDITNKPAALRRYKIQPGTNEPVEPKRLMKVCNVCLCLRHIYFISGVMLNEIFVYGLENFYFFMYFLPSATSVFVNPIVIILLVFPSSFSLTHFK
jgi:hypothetical protein